MSRIRFYTVKVFPVSFPNTPACLNISWYWL